MNNLGYTKNLFILPFDHRSSFAKIFQNKEDIISAKWIIYEAFKKALSDGISKDSAAILVDEEFGDKILLDAKNTGFTTILTTEKSGQKEFAFEYGNEFTRHIEKYKPTFAKALIRYNPEDDNDSKVRQQQQLKVLSDYCYNNGYKFLLEVLIPPTNTSEEPVPVTSEERSRASSPARQARESERTPPRWTQERYDKELRPKLAVSVIKELQNANVEPDVWKLEGMDNVLDYDAIVKQAQSGERHNVGIVVLGRGANQTQVEKWISVGAKVKGVIGFAVGRTVFWQPLVDLKNDKISKEETINQIANNFKYFYHVFMNSS